MVRAQHSLRYPALAVESYGLRRRQGRAVARRISVRGDGRRTNDRADYPREWNGSERRSRSTTERLMILSATRCGSAAVRRARAATRRSTARA